MAKLISRPEARDERLRNFRAPPRGTPLTSAEAQRLATDAALRGVGRVAPNPLVGAVVVDREHRFLGAGGHEAYGGHHGEVQAMIAAAGGEDWRGKLSGATVYVTLEPCAHTGRTPPCAPRLVEAGVAKVVFAVLDPTPKVNGRGAEILRAAGVEVVHDLEWAEAGDGEGVGEVFLGNARRGRPFVAVKAAASLDGAIARRGDRRQWITGARARQYGHFLRLWYDAVVVGRGTVAADDPTLDARDALVLGRVPWRVVLDPSLASYAPGRKILGVAPEKVIWVGGAAAWATAAGKRAQGELEGVGAKAVSVAAGASSRFAPRVLLSALALHGITSILLEGGAGTYAPFFAEGLVDKLHLIQAPVLFGDAGAIRFTDGAGALAPRRAHRLEWTPLGEDLLVEASFKEEP